MLIAGTEVAPNGGAAQGGLQVSKPCYVSITPLLHGGQVTVRNLEREAVRGKVFWIFEVGVP